MLIVAITAVAVVLIAIVTVAAFRALTEATGTKQHIEEGCVIVSDGIEFWPGFLLFGKKEKVLFREIDSVKLIPFYKTMLLSFRFCNGKIRPASKYVLVEFTRRQLYLGCETDVSDGVFFGRRIRSVSLSK
jgi:hypothetical protein